MIKTKRIEDYSLSDEVDRYWAEILDRTYVFDRRQIEVSSLMLLFIYELSRDIQRKFPD